jgi:hypothetical protein
MLTMVSICHCHMSMYTLIWLVGQNHVLASHKAPMYNVIYEYQGPGPSFLVGLLPRLERRHRHRRTAPQAAWPHRRPPPAGNPAPPAPAAEPPGPARDKASDGKFTECNKNVRNHAYMCLHCMLELLQTSHKCFSSLVRNQQDQPY